VRRHSICECFSICESEGRASTPRRDKKYRGRDSHDFLIHFEPATFGDFILSGSRILADYESRPRRRSRRNGPSYATPATSTVLGNYVIFCFLRDQHLARSTDPFENLLHTTFQNPLVDEYWPPSAGRQMQIQILDINSYFNFLSILMIALFVLSLVIIFVYEYEVLRRPKT
jgi:hypothetical protein